MIVCQYATHLKSVTALVKMFNITCMKCSAAPLKTSLATVEQSKHSEHVPQNGDHVLQVTLSIAHVDGL